MKALPEAQRVPFRPDHVNFSDIVGKVQVDGMVVNAMYYVQATVRPTARKSRAKN